MNHSVYAYYLLSISRLICFFIAAILFTDYQYAKCSLENLNVTTSCGGCLPDFVNRIDVNITDLKPVNLSMETLNIN